MIPTKKSWSMLLLCTYIFFHKIEGFDSSFYKNLLTFSYWSVLATPYVKDAHALSANTYHSYIPVEPAVDAFVRTILRMHGCSERIWQPVRIVQGRRFASDSIWHTIEVPISEKYLKAALHAYRCNIPDCTQCASYHRVITKETLSVIIGAILHEAGHLAHHDIQKWVSATMITPVGIHCALDKIRKSFSDTPMGVQITKNTHPWHRTIYNLVGTILISDILLTMLKKQSEKHADQFAIDHIDDPEILSSISKDFATDHAAKRKRFYHWKKKFYACFPVPYELTTGCHPSDCSRAQRFAKAAEFLRSIPQY